MYDTIEIQISNSNHTSGSSSIEQPVVSSDANISNTNLYEIKNSRIYIKEAGVYSAYFSLQSNDNINTNWSGWLRIQAQYDNSSDIMDVSVKSFSGFPNYGIYAETTKPCMILNKPASIILRWIFTVAVTANIRFQICRIA